MSDKVIKIVNGQPEGYPFYLINIIHAYPEFEDGVTREELQARGFDFVIEESAPTSIYVKNVVQNPCQLIDGNWTITWSFDEMTRDEKIDLCKKRSVNDRVILDNLEIEIQRNLDLGIDTEKWEAYKQRIIYFRRLPVEDPHDVVKPTLTDGILSDVIYRGNVMPYFSSEEEFNNFMFEQIMTRVPTDF